MNPIHFGLIQTFPKSQSRPSVIRELQERNEPYRVFSNERYFGSGKNIVVSGPDLDELALHTGEHVPEFLLGEMYGHQYSPALQTMINFLNPGQLKKVGLAIIDSFRNTDEEDQYIYDGEDSWNNCSGFTKTGCPGLNLVGTMLPLDDK